MREMLFEKTDFKVLVADDEKNIRDTITRVLSMSGFPRTVALADGQAAIDRLASERFDLVITDLEMPGARGDQVAAAAKGADPDQAILVISGFLTSEEQQLFDSLGVRKCLKKPMAIRDLSEAVERAFGDLTTSLAERADLEALNAMTDASWRDNGYRPEVQRLLLRKGIGIGRRLGFSLYELWILEVAFLVRDLGMSRVEREIREKSSVLTGDERARIQRHIEYSREMARHMVNDPAVYQVVQGHHERRDGSGHPEGLKGSQIDRLAVIISLLDTYVALRSARPYRPELGENEIARELRREEGIHWDRKMLDLLLES